MIADALAYPFRGEGKLLFITGLVCFLIVSVIRPVPALGWAAYYFAVIYFATFILDVVRTTAKGQEECPNWPNLGDDFIETFLCILVAAIVSFFPAAVIYYFDLPRVLLVALIILGLYHFPMAILYIALFDSVNGANPICTIPAILKNFPAYTGFVLVLGLLTLVSQLLIERALLSYLPVVAFVLSRAFNFYCCIFLGRLLGLFYRNNPNLFDQADPELG